MQNIKQMRFFNPASGREVGYWSAKVLGIIPQELLDAEKAASSRSIRKSASAAPVLKGEVKVKTVKIKDLDFDKRLFVPMSTGNSVLDSFVSSEGGFMPASNVVMIGSPGIGKSTVSLDLLSRLARNAKKRVLFVSGEMNRIDMYRYCRRFPEFGSLDTLFLSDYSEVPQQAIEQAFKAGYDAILIDSFAEVITCVQEANGWSSKRSETWLIDLMEHHNEGNNDTNSFTCFLVIQQVTKSGEFLGSNRLKHMTSAMLQMYRDRDNDCNVMEFTKNRLGAAGEQIAFRIDTGSVNFSYMPDSSTDDDTEDGDGE